MNLNSTPYTIRSNIKIKGFGRWLHFYYIMSWRVYKTCWHTTEHKENLIRNINNQNHQNYLNPPQTKKPYLFGNLCLSWWNFNQNKHHLCSGPSNEHSYQVWFQRRRLKCKGLWVTISNQYISDKSDTLLDWGTELAELWRVDKKLHTWCQGSLKEHVK